MPRVKQIALSDPPSQEPLEGGSDSALPFTSNTVAASSLNNLPIMIRARICCFTYSIACFFDDV